MREIMFRGKGNKEYNDGNWYYGVPLQCHDGDWQICTNNIKRVVISETIGQYTGITDKNGKEIFEGDLIKQDSAYKPIISCVRICEEPLSDLYGVCEEFLDGSGKALLRVNNNCEIIGNIFENPELLRSDAE